MIAGSMFLAGCVALDMAQTAVTSEALRHDSTAPVPLELPFGLSADVYPPPIQKSDTGALLAACPNPDGLEAASAIPTEEAVRLLAELWSGDVLAMQGATDPAMWTALTQLGARPGACAWSRTSRSSLMAGWPRMSLSVGDRNRCIHGWR